MTSIYVGNLSYTTTEDDLREAFAQYGKVSGVNIVKDRETGRPRGFAFVEMADGQEASTEQERGWRISLDATSTSVLNAVDFVLQAAVGRWPHFPERSLGCRTKTGSLGNPL